MRTSEERDFIAKILVATATLHRVEEEYLEAVQNHRKVIVEAISTTQLTPHDLAKDAGLSVNSVRNIVKRYSESVGVKDARRTLNSYQRAASR